MARKRPAPVRDDRLALFAAVKEAPDDDAPRLVLADWLEEYGDEDDRAHAELIRVQCELLRRTAEAVAPEDPGPIHALLRGAGSTGRPRAGLFAALAEQDERVVALRQRERELVKRFSPPGSFGTSRPWGAWGWYRGFASLSLAGPPFRSRELAAFAATPAALRVEALELAVAPRTSAQVARTPLLAQAIGLEVRGEGGEAALATLLASEHLTGLRRYEQAYIGAGVAALWRAPQRERITHLSLPQSGLGPGRLRALVSAGWPSLVALHLEGDVNMGPQGAAALGGAPFLAGIRELGLRNCRINAERLESLVGAPAFRCPHLLELSVNRIGPVGVHTLLAAPGLERLVFLGLANTRLDGSAVAVLAGSPRLTGLLHLDVSYNPAVGPTAAEALAASPHLRRLASLEVLSCPIGEAGARALLRSPHLRRLRLALDRWNVSAGTLAELRQRFLLTDHLGDPLPGG